jgi:predicted transcriptional regulator
MTLMLTLSPETEARLNEIASLHGQKPEEYALRVLDEMALADKTEFDAAVAGLRRGMADAAAGREIALEDYLAEITREQPSRRQDATQEAA